MKENFPEMYLVKTSLQFSGMMIQIMFLEKKTYLFQGMNYKLQLSRQI